MNKTFNKIGLNPLRIGEGFELIKAAKTEAEVGLNPLRIGEGFELKVEAKSPMLGVLIP